MTTSTLHWNENSSREIKTALCIEKLLLVIGVSITKMARACGWYTSQMSSKLQTNQTLNFKILPNPKIRIKLQNEYIIA